MEIGGHPEFRKENNKLRVSHVTGVRTQNSLFIFKNQNRGIFLNSIRNAFKNETTIRPPAHTHNANAESEEISPYDSQRCLIRIKKKHLILLLVHSV